MASDDTDIDTGRFQELQEFFDSIGLGSDSERDSFLELRPSQETNDYSKYLKTTTVTARNH